MGLVDFYGLLLYQPGFKPSFVRRMLKSGNRSADISHDFIQILLTLTEAVG